MQKYVFRKYNPKFRNYFISEQKKISKTLGSSAKIEHIGSTAIPDLGGKGILDIVVGVSKSKIVVAKKRLNKAGYEFREKASYPERLFFRRDYLYKNRKRRVHIHLTRFNSNDWKELIGFRDYLLKNPDTIEQYVQIKREGVKKAHGDGEKYRKHKEKFIKNIFRKALK